MQGRNLHLGHGGAPPAERPHARGTQRHRRHDRHVKGQSYLENVLEDDGGEDAFQRHDVVPTNVGKAPWFIQQPLSQAELIYTRSRRIAAFLSPAVTAQYTCSLTWAAQLLSCNTSKTSPRLPRTARDKAFRYNEAHALTP